MKLSMKILGFLPQRSREADARPFQWAGSPAVRPEREARQRRRCPLGRRLLLHADGPGRKGIFPQQGWASWYENGRRQVWLKNSRFPYVLYTCYCHRTCIATDSAKCLWLNQAITWASVVFLVSCYLTKYVLTYRHGTNCCSAQCSGSWTLLWRFYLFLCIYAAWVGGWSPGRNTNRRSEANLTCSDNNINRINLVKCQLYTENSCNWP